MTKYTTPTRTEMMKGNSYAFSPYGRYLVWWKDTTTVGVWKSDKDTAKQVGVHCLSRCFSAIPLWVTDLDGNVLWTCPQVQYIERQERLALSKEDIDMVDNTKMSDMDAADVIAAALRRASNITAASRVPGSNDINVKVTGGNWYVLKTNRLHSTRVIDVDCWACEAYPNGPAHYARPNCKSGKRHHCSCDICY